MCDCVGFLCVCVFVFLHHHMDSLGGFISISGGWILLLMVFIMGKDSPPTTMLHMQCITMFQCSLGVLAGVYVL